MVTILDRLTPEAEMAERMGKGLSSGLKSLIDAKLGQLQKQAGLSAFMDPQQAKAMSFLPPYLLFSLMSRSKGGLKFLSDKKLGGAKLSGLTTKDKSATPVSGIGGIKQAMRLDKSTAQIILQAAGGDKKIARSLAKELGYTL